MGTRKMFVWMWITTGVICISVIAGGCAMPTSNVPTTPGPTQAPIASETPKQPVAAPSDLLPSPSSGAPSGSYGLTPVQVGSQYGFINSTGKLIINPQFDDANYFYEGLAAVRVGSSETGKWGFIDQSGKFVINPQFEDAWDFSEDLARVSVGGKYGYIDKTGSYIINPQFDNPDDPSEVAFSEGLARVKAGGKWGYIDKTGNFIINPQFDYAGDFSDGLAAVMVGGKRGYIDKTGNFIINPQFDYAGDFSEGLAGVVVEHKYGFIDKTGGFAINPQFDSHEGTEVPSVFGIFSEDLARVSVGGKWGFIDKTGSFIINPQFDWAVDFSEGLARVKVGDKWGYIDKTPEVRFVWNPDNIQLASEPSSQPSSPGPTIPTTQASSVPQSEAEQDAAIANAMVEAFNTANPEPLEKYIEPYFRDDVYRLIMIRIFNLRLDKSDEWLNYPFDSLERRWKGGTVKLAGFIRENYLSLRVKVTGFWNADGTNRTEEYWVSTANNSGRVLIKRI